MSAVASRVSKQDQNQWEVGRWQHVLKHTLKKTKQNNGFVQTSISSVLETQPWEGCDTELTSRTAGSTTTTTLKATAWFSCGCCYFLTLNWCSLNIINYNVLGITPTWVVWNERSNEPGLDTRGSLYQFFGWKLGFVRLNHLPVSFKALAQNYHLHLWEPCLTICKQLPCAQHDKKLFKWTSFLLKTFLHYIL